MATRVWKVYGAEGHRQRESFNSSQLYDFSTSESGNIRLIRVYNSDMTGTNEYTIVSITRNTPEECFDELIGQISDGIFENCRVGKFEEVENFESFADIIHLCCYDFIKSLLNSISDSIFESMKEVSNNE